MAEKAKLTKDYIVNGNILFSKGMILTSIEAKDLYSKYKQAAVVVCIECNVPLKCTYTSAAAITKAREEAKINKVVEAVANIKEGDDTEAEPEKTKKRPAFYCATKKRLHTKECCYHHSKVLGGKKGSDDEVIADKILPTILVEPLPPSQTTNSITTLDLDEPLIKGQPRRIQEQAQTKLIEYFCDTFAKTRKKHGTNYKLINEALTLKPLTLPGNIKTNLNEMFHATAPRRERGKPAVGEQREASVI